MKIKSKRCGKGDTCPSYDKHNPISGCKIYDDRNKCSLSLKNRRRAAHSSRLANAKYFGS